MPEEKKLTILQQQKLIKPTPESLIPELCDDDMMKNALNFITWLRDNKLTPRWTGIHTWKINYRSKYICYINFAQPQQHQKFWDVKLNRLFLSKYENYIANDELKSFVLDVIQPQMCNRKCGNLKINKEVFKKKHDKICACWPFLIKNPNGEALKNLKQLIILSRDILVDLTAAIKT